MLDKEQKGRFSKMEMELIRNTFGNDDTLLLKIRNVLLQLSEEKVELTPDVLALLNKSILPELTTEVPIGQQVDLLFTLPAIQQMNPGVAFLHIKAKDVQETFLRQRLAVLAGVETDEMSLKELRERFNKTEDTRFIDTLAYVNTVSYIETRLNEIKTLANSKELTEDEKKKMEMQNSNR